MTLPRVLLVGVGAMLGIVLTFCLAVAVKALLEDSEGWRYR